QLTVEKKRLENDVRELAIFLESSPMDTILEYNKNMTTRRLSVLDEFLVKAQNIHSIKFEKPVSVEPLEAASQESPKLDVQEDRLESTPVVPIPDASAKPPAPAPIVVDEAIQIVQKLRESLDSTMQN